MRVRMEQSKKRATNQAKEEQRKSGNRQLIQLVISVLLFLTVFVGKGAFPERVAQVGPQLLGVIRGNTDFRTAFASLGGAMMDSEVLPDELKDFCVEVFGIQPADIQGQSSLEPGIAEVLQPEPLQNEVVIVFEPEPELPEYQVGDVVETVVVEGQVLPENYTYDRLFLGDIKMENPVEGKLTSAFGYRDHPTIGRYAVHGGVDIGATMGASVRAFADGTVEHVGESEDFGLYLRLKHENGISTFYSHCQSIQVEKGQQVEAGQQVALVGSTGNSTGPHLHFEIQLGQTRLDPMHYITLKED